MFDIAWSEFLVVAVVALVVVGPRDLPPLLRTLGKMVASLRRMAGEFQNQFNDALREAELDEFKNEVTGLKDKASRMMATPNPLQIARDEIRTALQPKPAPSALVGTRTEAVENAPSALAPTPEIAPTETPPAVTEAELTDEKPTLATGTADAPPLPADRTAAPPGAAA